MSSHREAPEISKDPVADNTDVYAFVSRDEPDKVTIIANFIPFQNPQGGPELLRVRRRRHLRHPHQQPRQGAGRHHLPVPLPHRGTQPRDVPLQHRPDPLDRGHDLEPAAVLPRHAHRGRRKADGARQGPARPARQRRARAARRTTQHFTARPCTTSATAARCSPVNAPRGSTSTSAASSTSARCGRSSTCT